MSSAPFSSMALSSQHCLPLGRASTALLLICFSVPHTKRSKRKNKVPRSTTGPVHAFIIFFSADQILFFSPYGWFSPSSKQNDELVKRRTIIIIDLPFYFYRIFDGIFLFLSWHLYCFWFCFFLFLHEIFFFSLLYRARCQRAFTTTIFFLFSDFPFFSSTPTCEQQTPKNDQ